MSLSPSMQWQEIEAALLLSRLPGVGAATFKNLLQQYKTPSKALQHFKPTIQSNKKLLDTKKAIEFLQENPDIHITWPFHTQYPKTLLQISEPPPVIFLKGDLSILENNKIKIAIVGARQASPHGLKIAKQITQYACRKNAVIISGLAEGIDTQAHQTALQAQQQTIGVIATGIDICYPPTNQELFNTIGSIGLLCTEFFPHTPPRASYFPTRNRIIAALADIVIMIEGKKKSGALYTIKNALKFHKQTLACDPQTPHIISAGLEQAVQYGATIYTKKLLAEQIATLGSQK